MHFQISRIHPWAQYPRKIADRRAVSKWFTMVRIRGKWTTLTPFVPTMGTKIFCPFFALWPRLDHPLHFPGKHLMNGECFPDCQSSIALITAKVDYMVTLDISGELSAWLSTDEAKRVVAEIFREVVRDELQTLLRDDLVDTSEAAALLGMSVAAVRKAVERGQLPCIRIGRRLRFRRADLLHR